MPAPVVFFDKDGTLVENVPYSVDSASMQLLPGTGEALKALHGSGWRLAVVSNQSGVARGLFSESALVAVEAHLREMVADFGVPLAGFYYCPHHPKGIVPEYTLDCPCRKPAPGLILSACKQLEVDPRDCWLVGDSLSDVEAGQRAGCRTILLGSDLDLRGNGNMPADQLVVSSLVAASSLIMGSRV
jgi:D-glycero-D-manno-heptose 1,7-bisphosphate phosphatase